MGPKTLYQTKQSPCRPPVAAALLALPLVLVWVLVLVLPLVLAPLQVLDWVWAFAVG